MDKRDNLLTIAKKEGDQIFTEILKDYPELDKDDPRQLAIVTSLFINCIDTMRQAGCSKEFLQNKLKDYLDEEGNRE